MTVPQKAVCFMHDIDAKDFALPLICDGLVHTLFGNDVLVQKLA